MENGTPTNYTRIQYTKCARAAEEVPIPGATPTESDQIRPNPTKSDQVRPRPTESDQIRPSDRVQPNPTKFTKNQNPTKSVFSLAPVNSLDQIPPNFIDVPQLKLGQYFYPAASQDAR